MTLLGIIVFIIIWTILAINDGLWSGIKTWENRTYAHNKGKKIYHSYGENCDVSIVSKAKGQRRMYWDANGEGYTMIVSKPDIFGKQKVYLETAQYNDKRKSNQPVKFKLEDIRSWKAMGMI